MTPINPPQEMQSPSFDPVVEEVRERSEILMARFKGNLAELFKYLRQMAVEHPHQMVGQISVVAAKSS
jgi:hypothetical protein